MRRLAGSLRSISLASLGLGVSTFCGTAFAADNGPAAAPDAVAVTAADQQHLAIALRLAAPAVQVNRHILLVDTSASQSGIYRQRTLQAVRSVLQGLPQGSQVRLVAADSSVSVMTPEFVSLDSPQLSAALNRLSLRTPMGATDLAAALRSSLQGVSESAVSIAYIGDGMSAGDMLSGTDLSALVTDLQTSGAAFHAMLLGPRVDAQLSGILANQTGGSLQQLQNDDVASVAGLMAGQLQQGPVLVRDLRSNTAGVSLTAPAAVALRSNRHTLVYGAGAVPAVLEVTGTINGKSQTWKVAGGALRQGGSEIGVLARKAQQTQGLNSPYLGLEGLAAASGDFTSLIGESIAAAEVLSQQGQKLQALEIVSQARLLDSGNVRLTALETALLDETGKADRLGPPSVDEGDALSKTEVRGEILTQRMVQSVNAAIDEADRVAAEQPEYAMTLLKDVLEAVRSSREIAPEKRQELERRVVAAYTRVDSARQTNEIRQLQLSETRANLEAQRERLAQVNLEEQRLRTLIDQVRGLLERARRGDVNAYEDAEAVSREALRDEPGNGTATAALVMSEASGQLQKAYDLINLRNDRFLETLYQVELSHVPFPDEPPVQYPPADVWRALTIKRKEKYKSLSLRSIKPVEEWLEKKLDEPLPRALSYPGDNSLGEILRFIADAYTAEGPYTMRIILDESDPDLGDKPTFLDDTQVADVDLAGITMRNALELIFAKVKDQELTVMIKNEVMMVTTVATAESEENLVTRIYDVADLVVITMPGMGGGMGSMGGSSTKMCVAVYEAVAGASDEISCPRGTVLEIIKEVDQDWIIVRDPKTGKTEHVSSNIVDIRLRDDLERLKKMRAHRGVRHDRSHRDDGVPSRAERRYSPPACTARYPRRSESSACPFSSM